MRNTARLFVEKQKRWVFPEVHGITSPFVPAGWFAPPIRRINLH
jgi:hypothetical protein